VIDTKWKRPANPARGNQVAELIIKNTYRTLMTRGMKGCYVWSSDYETLQWLTQKLENP
jgi:uncharacterized protein